MFDPFIILLWIVCVSIGAGVAAFIGILLYHLAKQAGKMS